MPNPIRPVLVSGNEAVADVMFGVVMLVDLVVGLVRLPSSLRSSTPPPPVRKAAPTPYGLPLLSEPLTINTRDPLILVVGDGAPKKSPAKSVLEPTSSTFKCVASTM